MVEIAHIQQNFGVFLITMDRDQIPRLRDPESIAANSHFS
jgi:hypothetical protein